MPLRLKELKLVDLVWAEVCDAEWHSLKEIAQRVRPSYGRVTLVVDLLEKYGFIQSDSKNGRRFRINPGAPSPMEVADGLRSLLGAYGAELSSRYIF